jgi:hypothetical protein
MTVKGCLQEDRIFGKCNFYNELTLLSHASLIVHNLEILQLRDGTFISLLPFEAGY